MSETTHAEGEQLFDTTSDEVVKDGAKDTEGVGDKKPKETPEDELEQKKGLELETDKTPKEEAKLKLLSSVQRKIDEGETTLEDLKPAQAWMKDYLKPPKAEYKATAREAAQEVIQEEREKAQYVKLLDTLEKVATNDQKEVITKKYNHYRKKLTDYEALELATQLVGVDLEGKDKKARAMRIPINKETKKVDLEGTPYGEIHDALPEEERQDYLRSLING